MRIAVLGARGYPSSYGGYETFVRHFVPHATKRGHELLVYCRWRRNDQWSWQVDGATCRATPGIETKSLSTLSFGLTESIDVMGRPVDVALIMNCANGLWLPLINAVGLPAALNVDGVEWEREKWNRIGRGLFHLGAGMASRRAAALIADSRAIRDIWRAEFGASPEFIPYGAPIVEDDATDELEELGIPAGEYVLTVARLVPENNVSLALDAVDALNPRPPYVIVGTANYDSELERRVAALAQRSDVWWLGHVRNQRLLTQLWRHCAVYVHAHSVGGTNPALLQALGAGAPTLALDTVFNREVIGDADAFFGAARDGLVSALELTLSSSERRRFMREWGQQRVREAYRWEDVCDRYLGLLEAIARDEGRSS